MKRRAATVTAVLVAIAGAAGCGEDRTPAEEVVAETQNRLDDITSGVLDFELAASTLAGEGDLGFRVKGPFAVATEKGKLPVLDVQYTRFTGDRRRTTGYVSTGSAAFVKLDGRAWKLEADQVRGLRAADDDTGGGGLGGLDLTGWAKSATLDRADGETDRVTGALDPVPALNGILALARQFGVEEEDGPAAIDGDGAESVEQAVKRARYTLVTTDDDRYLRRFEATIEFAVDHDDDLADSLGRYAGTRIRFVVDVDDINRRFRVEAPAAALPISERDDGGGSG